MLHTANELFQKLAFESQPSSRKAAGYRPRSTIVQAAISCPAASRQSAKQSQYIHIVIETTHRPPF